MPSWCVCDGCARKHWKSKNACRYPESVFNPQPAKDEFGNDIMICPKWTPKKEKTPKKKKADTNQQMKGGAFDAF